MNEIVKDDPEYNIPIAIRALGFMFGGIAFGVGVIALGQSWRDFIGGDFINGGFLMVGGVLTLLGGIAIMWVSLSGKWK